MRTVGDLLHTKGHEVLWVVPHTSVYDALQLMVDKNVGALLVLEADQLVGVFSERDYARKGILKGKFSKDTSVKEMMTSTLNCVYLDESIEECMVMMTDRRVRHLPVLEDDQLVGVISIGDVLKALISEKEFLIEQLENYITGTR
jgi:CBS domain-containing protein